jgi:hypothetical protein
VNAKVKLQGLLREYAEKPVSSRTQNQFIRALQRAEKQG